MTVNLEIGVVQLAADGDDRAGTVERAAKEVAAAAARGARLVLLPEFFDTPYFPQFWDADHQRLAEPEDGPGLTAMREAARAAGVWVCAPVYELERPGLRYDSAVLVDPAGQVAGKYRKVHAPAIHGLEKIYYRQGSRFPTWDVDGVRVGVATCYDVYFPESVRTLALAGAELVLAPFAARPQPLWVELMRVRAFENGVYLAVCNKVGTEPSGWTNAGASMVVAPDGELLHLAGDTPESFLATVDLDRVDAARRAFPMLRDRRPECYARLCRDDEDNLALT